MDENKISNIKRLLYDTDNDEVKRIIFQAEASRSFICSILIIITGTMGLIFHK